MPPAPTALARRVRAALSGTFHMDRLRPGQKAVIDRVLAGRNTLAIMPTGAGKSLCYQLPALLLPGRTIVVSPLIALMKDQCESLRERGVNAVQINSAMDSAEAQAAEAAALDGSARIVMTTPEKLAEPGFVEKLAQHPTSLLAVDEAHCISQWGHDFRPAFLDIGHAVPGLGRPVVLALTATATDDVARDIGQQLGIAVADIVHTGSYRPNLALAVEQVAREEDKLARAVALVKAAQGSGLVYTATIKAAQEVQAALHAAGEEAGLYHGKLPAAVRHAAQEGFMNGQVRVMVATNAFGLGIDKADIRFVLHYQLPPGLEAYYQEAGRAGRDGKAALCTLLFLRRDKAVQQFFMAGRYPSDDDAAALLSALRSDPPDAAGWTLPLLQAQLDRPRKKLMVALGLLRRQKIVAASPNGHLRLLKDDVQQQALAGLMTAYRDKRALDRQTLERMVFYAQTGQCRWRLLMEHLEGEASFERCRHCDNCLRIARQEATLAAREAEAPRDASGTSTHQEHTAPSFKPGEIVRVKRYGRGEVREANSWQVTVAFADGSERSFQPEFVAKAALRGAGRREAAAAQPA